MHLRCGRIFIDTFTAESAGARILKTSQHLVQLWARVGCPF